MPINFARMDGAGNNMFCVWVPGVMLPSLVLFSKAPSNMQRRTYLSLL